MVHQFLVSPTIQKLPFRLQRITTKRRGPALDLKFAEPLTNLVEQHRGHMPHGMPQTRGAVAAEAYSYAHRNTLNPFGDLHSLPNQYLAMYSQDSTPVEARRQIPSTYAVASMATPPGFYSHFGVSAPNSRSSEKEKKKGKASRNCRMKQAYDNFSLERPTEYASDWHPGQCAENQSLPPVVHYACGHISETGQDAVIYSYAIGKDGSSKPMCPGCVALSQKYMDSNPQLRIVDAGVSDFQAQRAEHYPSAPPPSRSRRS